MNVDYRATDEALLRFVSPRVLEMAKQPFLRPGGFDLDIPYAMAVWDAKDRVSLAALVINNPGMPVHFPPHAPYMGFVPNGR
jgi:hypothetical protein